MLRAESGAAAPGVNGGPVTGTPATLTARDLTGAYTGISSKLPKLPDQVSVRLATAMVRAGASVRATATTFQALDSKLGAVNPHAIGILASASIRTGTSVSDTAHLFQSIGAAAHTENSTAAAVLTAARMRGIGTTGDLVTSFHVVGDAMSSVTAAGQARLAVMMVNGRYCVGAVEGAYRAVTNAFRGMSQDARLSLTGATLNTHSSTATTIDMVGQLATALRGKASVDAVGILAARVVRTGATVDDAVAAFAAMTHRLPDATDMVRARLAAQLLHAPTDQPVPTKFPQGPTQPIPGDPGQVPGQYPDPGQFPGQTIGGGPASPPLAPSYESYAPPAASAPDPARAVPGI